MAQAGGKPHCPGGSDRVPAFAVRPVLGVVAPPSPPCSPSQPTTVLPPSAERVAGLCTMAGKHWAALRPTGAPCRAWPVRRAAWCSSHRGRLSCQWRVLRLPLNATFHFSAALQPGRESRLRLCGGVGGHSRPTFTYSLCGAQQASSVPLSGDAFRRCAGGSVLLERSGHRRQRGGLFPAVFPWHPAHPRRPARRACGRSAELPLHGRSWCDCGQSLLQVWPGICPSPTSWRRWRRTLVGHCACCGQPELPPPGMGCCQLLGRTAPCGQCARPQRMVCCGPQPHGGGIVCPAKGSTDRGASRLSVAGGGEAEACGCPVELLDQTVGWWLCQHRA